MIFNMFLANAITKGRGKMVVSDPVLAAIAEHGHSSVLRKKAVH